jgi:hypothetical protein
MTDKRKSYVYYFHPAGVKIVYKMGCITPNAIE